MRNKLIYDVKPMLENYSSKQLLVDHCDWSHLTKVHLRIHTLMKSVVLFVTHLMFILNFNVVLQMAEYRISIYGRKQSEWDQLASWIVNNDLYSDNVVWLIQVILVSSHKFCCAPYMLHISSIFPYIKLIIFCRVC